MQDYLLRVLEGLNKTILFITHDIDEALFLSDRVIVLGGTPAEIIEIEEMSLERPRGREMVLSSRFLQVKKQLIRLLG
jgi:ABC-type nitrate/sulfonate/bicarbonate transport system ATPase subunit